MSCVAALATHCARTDSRGACMGGCSDVPLGFVSLSENLMMLGMGLWMLVRLAG